MFRNIEVLLLKHQCLRHPSPLTMFLSLQLVTIELNHFHILNHQFKWRHLECSWHNLEFQLVYWNHFTVFSSRLLENSTNLHVKFCIKSRNWMGLSGGSTTTKDIWSTIWGDRGGVYAENIDTKDFWALKTIF